MTFLMPESENKKKVKGAITDHIKRLMAALNIEFEGEGKIYIWGGRKNVFRDSDFEK